MKSKEKRECIEGVSGVSSSRNCLKPCAGLSLTSYLKTKSERNFENLIPKELKAYQLYLKPHFPFPPGIKGKIFLVPKYLDHRNKLTLF